MLYSGDVMYKLLQEKEGDNYELNSNPFLDKHHLQEGLPYWNGTVAGIDISVTKEINWNELFQLVKRAYHVKSKEQIKAKYIKPKFTNGN